MKTAVVFDSLNCTTFLTRLGDGDDAVSIVEYQS